jgi:hypothetical protein
VGFSDGMDKIRDGICGMIFTSERNDIPIPSASMPEDICIEPGEILALVDIDVDAYRRRIGTKAVRRTISIPEWMDAEAARRNFSLSQITQDALAERLK